ncbi:MAG: YncE family protein [Candidatus Kryptoniota bacterium]
MKTITVTLSFLLLLYTNKLSIAQTTVPSYKIVNRISLPGDNWWDYPSIEASTGRLFLSRGSMIQVVNVNDGTLIGEIPDTKGVHGIALAEDLGKGFASDGADSSVSVFDLKTLEVIEKVSVTGENPDAILYDAYTHRVFTCNGKTSNSTVIDAKTDKVIGTIPLSGRPEFCVTDGVGEIYINIEDKSQIDEIDAAKMKVENVWSISPGESPSGLAIDAQNHILFSVCHNKLMAVLDARTGRVITTLAIGSRVDGAAFDPELMRAYSSNGDGTLTIVQEESNDTFKVIENLKTQLGARTITIDTKTHHLYLPTAEFNPPPAATTGNPHPRPTMKPGSFVVLEVEEVK